MHWHLLSEILDPKGLVVGASGLEDLRFRCAIVTVGPDAVKLEADASRAGPCVSGRGITLDLSSPTALTGSHNLESLVTIMLIHEHIILLGFPGLVWLGREAEVGHLGALREQPPS